MKYLIALCVMLIGLAPTLSWAENKEVQIRNDSSITFNALRAANESGLEFKITTYAAGYPEFTVQAVKPKDRVSVSIDAGSGTSCPYDIAIETHYKDFILTDFDLCTTSEPVITDAMLGISTNDECNFDQTIQIKNESARTITSLSISNSEDYEDSWSSTKVISPGGTRTVRPNDGAGKNVYFFSAETDEEYEASTLINTCTDTQWIIEDDDFTFIADY